MFARFFLPLCLFALFAVAVYADEAEEQHNDDLAVADRANPAVKIVAKLIGKVFAGAAASCLMEAAGQCKQHWKNPGAAVNCGKQFLNNNRGRCAAGK